MAADLPGRARHGRQPRHRATRTNHDPHRTDGHPGRDRKTLHHATRTTRGRRQAGGRPDHGSKTLHHATTTNHDRPRTRGYPCHGQRQAGDHPHHDRRTHRATRTNHGRPRTRGCPCRGRRQAGGRPDHGSKTLHHATTTTRGRSPAGDPGPAGHQRPGHQTRHATTTNHDRRQADDHPHHDRKTHHATRTNRGRPRTRGCPCHGRKTLHHATTTTRGRSPAGDPGPAGHQHHGHQTRHATRTNPGRPRTRGYPCHGQRQAGGRPDHGSKTLHHATTTTRGRSPAGDPGPAGHQHPGHQTRHATTTSHDLRQADDHPHHDRKTHHATRTHDRRQAAHQHHGHQTTRRATTTNHGRSPAGDPGPAGHQRPGHQTRHATTTNHDRRQADGNPGRDRKTLHHATRTTRGQHPADRHDPVDRHDPAAHPCRVCRHRASCRAAGPRPRGLASSPGGRALLYQDCACPQRLRTDGPFPAGLGQGDQQNRCRPGAARTSPARRATDGSGGPPASCRHASLAVRQGSACHRGHHIRASPNGGHCRAHRTHCRQCRGPPTRDRSPGRGTACRWPSARDHLAAPSRQRHASGQTPDGSPAGRGHEPDRRAADHCAADSHLAPGPRAIRPRPGMDRRYARPRPRRDPRSRPRRRRGHRPRRGGHRRRHDRQPSRASCLPSVYPPALAGVGRRRAPRSPPDPAQHKNTLRAITRNGNGPQREDVRRRPTLPPSPPGSTIGAEGLNFRVRNGAGCFPFAMATETLWRCQERAQSRLKAGTRRPTASREPHSGRETRSMSRSQATRPISTGQLHTLPCFHLRPINPVV